MNAAREPERRYETLLELGTGGMATVFVGRARGAAGFSRLVALKRARAHVKRDPKLFAALEREAWLASRIHHSNVVGVIDVVEDEGDLVLVLEYVEGVSLADLAQLADRGGLAFSRLDVRTRARAVIRIVLDVAAGLDAAHRTEDEDGRLLGIVHRDVSPAIVLVGTDGVAKIADFGIAKSFDAHGDRTETDSLKGKVGYMAPEYIEHQSSTPAADLFALAVVAWESLTNTRLFRSATEIETLKRVVAGRVPDLGSVASVLAPLDPVIRRALAVRPDERQRNVAAFAAEVEAVARAHDLVASHAEVADVDGAHAAAPSGMPPGAAREWPDPGTTMRQAASCARPAVASGGTLDEHTCSTNEQRVWKRHPAGGSIGFGGSPASGATMVR